MAPPTPTIDPTRAAPGRVTFQNKEQLTTTLSMKRFESIV